MSSWSTTPEGAAYRRRELASFRGDLLRAERGSASEKREAAARMLLDLRSDPHLMGERAQWLVDGTFGAGAAYAVRDAFLRETSQGFRRWLFVSTAALDWMVPARQASRVWSELPKVTQNLVNGFLMAIEVRMGCLDHELHLAEMGLSPAKTEAARVLWNRAEVHGDREAASVLADVLEEAGMVAQAAALRRGDIEGVTKACLQLRARHGPATRLRLPRVKGT